MTTERITQAGIQAQLERLTPRRREILRRVILHYVPEVHPVSSQVVAEEIRVSSATVRNELAALEEQGYLKQLHTSGGRVPTDQAYRFFVEELVQHLSETLRHRAMVAEVYSQLRTATEALVEGTLDLLAEMTGYVAWISLPIPTALDIRSLSFVEVDTHELLVVLITGAGAMQNRLVRTSVPVKDLELGRLQERLNNYLRGRSVLGVDHAKLRAIFQDTVAVPEVLLETLQEFFIGLGGSAERVVFGNALHLALQPEFARAESLSSVLAVLQDKERFSASLRRQLGSESLQTIIGTENLDSGLHECSVVLSRYPTPEGEGLVGVLGPTRLMYERTLQWVKAIGGAVAQALNESGDVGK